VPQVRDPSRRKARRQGYLAPGALSASAAALKYGISRGVIAKAIRNGELPGYRIGARTLRVLPAEMERWIRSHRVTPTRDAEALAADLLEREGD
jgi:excisionase family DNA binding protein